MVDDILPENAVPAPEGTIFDRLDAHKIPWRNYYSSFPPTSYVFPGEAIEGHASLVKIEQFSPTPTTRNLAAMTGRDAAADLSDFLSLDQPPFAQPPTLGQPLAGPAQLACEKDGPGQIPPPGSVTPG
jgi:hypothetical protein